MTDGNPGWQLHYRCARGQAQHKDFLTLAEAEMAKAQMRFTFGDSAGYVATVTAKSTKEKGRKRSRDARPRRGVTKADIQLKWLRDQCTGALAYDRATYDATGHIATYTTVTVTGQRMQYFGTLAACRAAN